MAVKTITVEDVDNGFLVTVTEPGQSARKIVSGKDYSELTGNIAVALGVEKKRRARRLKAAVEAAK